jgi:2-polyprenyl-3-methyl-5-hydroxy-6-metoxy-1,4-benzoquinol methylase
MYLKATSSQYLKSELLKDIYHAIKDKRVLDVGCLGDYSNKSRFWIHDFLRKNSKCIGIDLNKNALKKLKKAGEAKNIILANAEIYTFKEKFDVIFAGELIEHLDNPGIFLKNMKKHLKKKGILILTTPNTYSLFWTIRALIKRDTNPPVNLEHVTFFTPQLLETLLKNNGWDPIKMDYFETYKINKIFLDRCRRFLMLFFPNQFKENFYIIAKNE